MTSHTSEFDDGIGVLPAGEPVLWRGQPRWQALAIRVFHVRAVALYFAALAIWRFASAQSEGVSTAASLMSAAWMIVPAAAAVGVLVLLAWLYARSTRYTITSRRVVMQIGVALPITLNIPFNTIAAASLKSYRDGTGDIPLSITGKERIAYLVLWPHARPWRLAKAEPMLRGLPDAREVAEVLARSVASASTTGPIVIKRVDADASIGASRRAAAAA